MSSTTQLSGLASGLDWQTLVAKLIAADRVPQDRLRTQKTLEQQKITSLQGLGDSLRALQTSVQSLSGKDDGLFNARTANSSDPASTWNLNASPGAAAGSYQISVSQLATKAQRFGNVDLGAPLSTTADVSGLTLATLPVATPILPGDFTVNGARITVASTDSLQNVFDQIASKTGGAVSASYDPAIDRVKLSSGSEIVLGSANDSSNFLGALQLFNNGTNEILPPKALGTISLSAAVRNANLKTAVTAVDGSGNGSFQINGVNLDYNVNSDSLQTIAARITASAAGVSASYDSGNDRFVLANKTTGDVGISVTETAGGLLGALGIDGGSTLVRGTNAQFSINQGATKTSTSNTLDAATLGIPRLSVTVDSTSAQTVTVGQDFSGLQGKVTDFVQKFNAVQSYIDSQTKTTVGANGKVSTSTLSGNREVTDIAGSLRSLVFNAVPGLSGSVQRMESLGLDFAPGSSVLVVKDPSALNNALQAHPEDVQSLFTQATTGFSARLDSYITKTLGSAGTITTQTQSLNKQSSSLDDQIAAMDRRLNQEQTLLTAGFVAMESAQSKIQTQLSALNNAFGNNNSSSSK